MAGVNVSPPPLNTPLIDMKTGMPTPAMVDFIHKIWLRTGGNDDNDDFLMRMLAGGGVPKGRQPVSDEEYRYRPPESPLQHEAIQQAQLAKLLAQVKQPDSPVMHEALSQADTATMLAQMHRPKSFDQSQIGKGSVPIGAIMLWSGSIASIPTGYALCDGSSGTPDVSNLFIRGATTDAAIGSTGGQNERTTNVTNEGTGGTVSTNVAGATAGSDFNALTGATFNDPGHSHNVTVTTIPEFYALALIMRIS